MIYQELRGYRDTMITCDFQILLNPKTVVPRLLGFMIPSYLASPRFSKGRLTPLNPVDSAMRAWRAFVIWPVQNPSPMDLACFATPSYRDTREPLGRWSEVRGYLAPKFPHRNLGRTSLEEWTGGAGRATLKDTLKLNVSRVLEVMESISEPKYNAVEILVFSVIGLPNFGLWACPEQCPKLVNSVCWVCEFPQQCPCPECPKPSKTWLQVSFGGLR
ncbi:hypothetical protein PIB30_060988 [Stylosanthes scabra]|uniref:Uncharacterized protein n=1 Tax=Stylosanthes scabra TaxID=79078 RepID=A0ABU6WP28_9FABA|nr:hypothetical protein [Stylosanthes scabra]